MAAGAHDKRCADATFPRCVCTRCAGTLHGWQGWLDLVEDPDERDRVGRAARERFVNERERRRKLCTRAIPRLRYRNAAVDAVRVEALSWLAGPGRERAAGTGVSADHDPSTRPAVRDLRAAGTRLTSVLEAVERDCGRLSNETRTALADHFWCDLLAHFAALIDEADKRVDQVPHLVADRLLTSRRAGKFAVVERKVVESAAKHLWQMICSSVDAGAFSQAKSSLPVIRLLALLLCKSPGAHPAVLRHAVDPLRHQFIDRTKEMLREVFAPDWIPGLAQAGTGT